MFLILFADMILNGDETNISSWRLKVWCKEKVVNEEGVE